MGNVHASGSEVEVLGINDGSASLTHGGEFKERQQATQKAMARVESVVSEHFPEVVDAVKAELAVVATGSIKDSPPTSLIFLGQSGAGKSLALIMLFPGSDDAALSERIYRSDEFTAASFL